MPIVCNYLLLFNLRTSSEKLLAIADASRVAMSFGMSLPDKSNSVSDVILLNECNILLHTT